MSPSSPRSSTTSFICSFILLFIRRQPCAIVAACRTAHNNAAPTPTSQGKLALAELLLKLLRRQPLTQRLMRWKSTEGTQSTSGPHCDRPPRGIADATRTTEGHMSCNRRAMHKPIRNATQIILITLPGLYTTHAPATLAILPSFLNLAFLWSRRSSYDTLTSARLFLR